MSTTGSASSQTVVASSAFLDLVGFSKLPTTVQVEAKDTFTLALRTGLNELGTSHCWVRDLGDGALVICPHSPEHALFLALRVQGAFASLAQSSAQPHLQLRIGLNLGVVKTSTDLDGRSNYLGDGINSTQRVMDFAQPGQILASRAFVDAIAYLHTDYAAMFGEAVSRQDKHGRRHEVHAVQPSASALERLTKDLQSGAPGAANANQTGAPGLAPLNKPAAAVHPSLTEHALSIVRNWFIPFNALLFSVGILWAGFQRFGLSPVLAKWIGPGLAIGGFATWLLVKHRSPKSSAMGFIVAAIGCMVTVTAWMAHASNEAAKEAPSQSLTKSPAPAATPDIPSQGPLPEKPTAIPDTAAPQATLTFAKKAPAARAQPTAEHPTAAAAVPSGDVNHARCTVLLNKSALGETISTAEKQELMQSCR